MVISSPLSGDYYHGCIYTPIVAVERTMRDKRERLQH